MKQNDVVILGAGIIGCALALELADDKLSVTVLEKGEPGREASWAAAGMLAPAAEHNGHPASTALARASAELYPGWAARLAARSALDLGYRTEGTLLVAFSEEEARLLPAAEGEPLSGDELHRREPALSARLVSGVYLPHDHQVDNRVLLAALLQAARAAGVEFRTGTEARELLIESGRAVGVRLADGSRLDAGAVVNAAGCWAGRMGPIAARLAPTRPVRGQVVALRREQPLLRHVVRSARAYLVPRADGRLLIGSTMEDAGYDKSVTPGVLRRLLAATREMIPAAAAMVFAEAWAGLRPDTPDHLPILGATDVENFFVATGHFRNGILLAPITARLLTEVILGRRPSLSLEPFSPLRFAAR
jgi:glycine oxidase